MSSVNDSDGESTKSTTRGNKRKTSKGPRTSIQTNFTVDPFNVQTTKWSRWVKRLEVAFKLFGVIDELKVPYLLHYMGTDAYDILSDKLAPEEPDSKDYEEIVKMMNMFYDPTPVEISEVFRFQCRKQTEGESVQEFLHAIQKMSIYCGFGEFLKRAQRNQFVCGLTSKRIQGRLLESRGLTLEKAVDIAVSMELSEKDANSLHKPDRQQVAMVNISNKKKINNNKFTNRNSDLNFKTNANYNQNKKYQGTKNNKERSCYRCGSKFHLANACDKINSAYCDVCKIKGHFTNVCTKRKLKENIKQIVEINNVSNHMQDKFFVKVNILNSSYNCELDSGSAVSILSLNLFQKHFKNFKVNKSDIQLISFCGTKLNVQGYVNVEISHKNQCHVLRLFVVKGGADALLIGRE